MGLWAEQDVQEQQLPCTNLAYSRRRDDTASATSVVPGLGREPEPFLPAPSVTDQAGIPRLVFPGAEQGTGSAHVLFPGALGPRVPDRAAAAAAGLGKEIQEQADQTRRKEVTELPLLLLGEAPTH